MTPCSIVLPKILHIFKKIAKCSLMIGSRGKVNANFVMLCCWSNQTYFSFLAFWEFCSFIFNYTLASFSKTMQFGQLLKTRLDRAQKASGFIKNNFFRQGALFSRKKIFLGVCKIFIKKNWTNWVWFLQKNGTKMFRKQ